MMNLTVERMIAEAPPTALGRIEYFTNILSQDVVGELAQVATDELFIAQRMQHSSQKALADRPAMSRCGPCSMSIKEQLPTS